MKGIDIILCLPVSVDPNECPDYRFNRKNLILAGLWFGRDSPTMTTFLQPLMEEIHKLSSNGTARYSFEIYMF